MIITIARKRFKGSVTDHIVSEGCGALNIRASRHLVGELTENPTCEEDFGRLPANLVIQHNETCVHKGTKRVRGAHAKKGQIRGSSRNLGHVYHIRPVPTHVFHLDENGLELVNDWDCEETCPFRIMNEVSLRGVKPSGVEQGGGSRFFKAIK